MRHSRLTEVDIVACSRVLGVPCSNARTAGGRRSCRRVSSWPSCDLCAPVGLPSTCSGVPCVPVPRRFRVAPILGHYADTA